MIKDKVLEGLSKAQILSGSKQLANALAYVCVTQFFIIAALLVTAYKLSERRETHYFFATADSTKQVIQMQRIEKTMEGMEQLVLNQTRLYMLYRETVEFQSESTRKRHEFVRAYSNDDVWYAFWRNMNPQDRNSFYSQLQERHQQRFVKIRNVSVHQAGKSILVDWDIYHYPDSYVKNWQYFNETDIAPEEHKRYRTILEYDIEKNKVFSDVAELNPLGIKIKSVKTTGFEYTEEVSHD